MAGKVDLPIERLNDGQPIIGPGEQWWEASATHNAAATYLERCQENEPLLRLLLGSDGLADPHVADGLVAIHYRARPKEDPGYLWSRSFVGLALFTPQLEPLQRYAQPVLSPGDDPDGYDYLGVEDPRITRLDGTFYMVYCGVARDPQREWRARVCLARSTDLLHWEKLGPAPGPLNDVNNKDGVLFPDQIAGHYGLLHRPMFGQPEDFAVALARSRSLSGPWEDLGALFRALPEPRYASSWVGAGSVPISLENGRYVLLYHTGHRLPAGDVEYDLDAALLDLRRLRSPDPSGTVVKRLEHIMVPATPWELNTASAHGVMNVLFICGSYEYRGDLYLIYGGADTVTLGARVNMRALVAALERG